MATLGPAWQGAITAFEQDLVRRAVADKTRTAYAIDCRQFGVWATAHGLDPATVEVRALRRYAAGLSEQGNAATTVARKLAALRGLFRAQVELGARRENPAELLSSPKRPTRLPRVLKAGEAADLLDGIPAGSPLELRDRALFELAYACGLRAEELVSLDLHSIDFDAETVRVEGKGGKTRIVPAGEHALRALERYLARARPALDTGQCSGLFLSKAGRRLSTSDVRRRLRRWAREAAARRPAVGDTHPTPCATRSPPTCSRVGRICGRSRNCWGMRPFRPRRSTLEWRRRGCGLRTRARIPEPEHRGENWKRTSKRSSFRTCGGATRRPGTIARASAWSWPTRRWSSTWRAG